MGKVIDSLVGVMLLFKNLLLTLAVMAIAQVELDLLSSNERVVYVVGVCSIIVGASVAELRFLDWVIAQVKQSRKG